MLVSDIFKPQNIKVNLESEDKEELFEELVNFVVDIEGLDEREAILNSLWERENKMTTGIAPNIAIPHTKLRSLDHIVGTLGISKEGIDYDSHDGNPVHLVMLLIADENRPEEHLQILKKIAMLLNNPDFYNKIIKCNKPEEVTEVIIEFEEIQ